MQQRQSRGNFRPEIRNGYLLLRVDEEWKYSGISTSNGDLRNTDNATSFHVCLKPQAPGLDWGSAIFNVLYLFAVS